MSRYVEYDDYDGPPAEFWEKRLELALTGRRGKAALSELREALLALPEKLLIKGALCNVSIAHEFVDTPPLFVAQPTGGYEANREAYEARWRYDAELQAFNARKELLEQGVGVCAVGAFLWHRSVKAGADPLVAFEQLPTLSEELSEDGGDNLHETARLAREAGLAYTLAWQLAYLNDEQFASLTAAQRYARFLEQIDTWLALPAAQRAPKRIKRQRRAEQRGELAQPAGVQGSLLR